MADENQEVDNPGADEAVAEEQLADQQVAQEQEMERFADQAGGGADPGEYHEPAPELGDLHKDYSIPGVDPSESNPYRWHTGEKRDHGGEDAIEVIDLVKQFGRTRILNGLNLGLPDDQISMVLGPSGTGKSVLIKHIVGLLYPDSGDLLVHGESVPNMSDDELFEMRKKFGLLFQDGALFGSMNIFDNVAFPLRKHTDMAESEIGDLVMSRLQEVGLERSAHKLPTEVSGGMRKRAGFARGLIMNPDIVLFDEPDSGLDPVRTSLLCDLIQQMHEEHGGTYLLVTHNISAAKSCSDYVGMIWQGKLVHYGDAAEAFNSYDPFVRQFLAGESAGPLGMD
jgi:phospholipid/cholesterol/gamma-HCH transport system ATP-binding protein